MRLKDLAKSRGLNQAELICPLSFPEERKGFRANIMALGDVGQNLLLGLKLLGGDLISEIGITDLQFAKARWLEMEMGQVRWPMNDRMPRVFAIDGEDVLDCDLLIFCATKGVPPLGTAGDMRLAQLEGNREIVEKLGESIKAKGFNGLVFLVSDPVDDLCNALLKSSGLAPGQIRGCGLGVMNARAHYYAGLDPAFSRYAEEGRAFGPHGEGLVIADSIKDYDHEVSLKLTGLVKNANMEIRELGYKPFIGPALSSGALSILEALKGRWSYGSVHLGDGKEGSYFGLLSRLNQGVWEYEDHELPSTLYERIQESYDELCER